MAETNLFYLQKLLLDIVQTAIGSDAVAYTAYDLARAGGQLSNAPAVYLLLDGITTKSSDKTSINVSQQWEISFSVPVAVDDVDGGDAMEMIGKLAYNVTSALKKSNMIHVRDVELVTQDMNSGLIGNRLVVPFVYAINFVMPL